MAASAAAHQVHLPLTSAASVVATLGNCSCIDLQKPYIKEFGCFSYTLLLPSTKLLLCYLKAGKNKSRVTPLGFLALQFLACSVPCAINHLEVFRLPVPLLTTG